MNANTINEVRVNRGLVYLDENYPDWFKHFTEQEINDLEVDDPYHCVRAVLAEKILGSGAYYDFPIPSGGETRYGFCQLPERAEPVNVLWRSAIRERQSIDT